MQFNQLKSGDTVHILEVLGTFKKNMEYNTGTIISVSKAYDEPMPQGQFPMPNQVRKKVIDLSIQSNGETKKFTVPEDRSTITDQSIGLTISTDKEEISNIIRGQYNIYKTRKESIAKCDEEMDKCRTILDKLGSVPENNQNDIIQTMQEEIKQLRQLLETKQANQ